MVKGVTPSTQRELCCSHRAFKVGLSRGDSVNILYHLQDCVLHETRACGGSGQMSAQDFARAMLDKSLGFLLKQCQVTRKKLFGKQNCIQWFSGLRTKQV